MATKTKPYNCLPVLIQPWQNSESVAEFFKVPLRSPESPSTTAPTMDTGLSRRSQALHWEPKLPFDFVTAYDDETMRDRTLVLCDRLAHTLQDDYDIRHSCWNFDALLDPRRLGQSIDAAVGADMIIIALHNAKELPRIARRWITGWLHSKGGQHCALVALTEAGPSARRVDCPVLRYLNSVARQAQMDFFSYVFPAAPFNVIDSFSNISKYEPAKTPLPPKEIPSRSGNISLWGINEY
jgi:hypothetical protein